MEKKQKIILLSLITLSIVLILCAIGILLFYQKKYTNQNKTKNIKSPKQHYVEKVALPSIKIFDVDELGNTPLHIACKYNHEAITIYCINRAVIECNELSTENILTRYLNQKNSFGETPLHLAIKNPSKDALDVILRSRVVDVNIQNNQGETPLHLAIRAGDKRMIEKLINKNADPKIKDDHGDDAFSLAKKLSVKLKIKDNLSKTR